MEPRTKVSLKNKKKEICKRNNQYKFYRPPTYVYITFITLSIQNKKVHNINVKQGLLHIVYTANKIL